MFICYSNYCLTTCCSSNCIHTTFSFSFHINHFHYLIFIKCIHLIVWYLQLPITIHNIIILIPPTLVAVRSLLSSNFPFIQFIIPVLSFPLSFTAKLLHPTILQVPLVPVFPILLYLSSCDFYLVNYSLIVSFLL